MGPSNSNRPYSINKGKKIAANKNTATRVGNKLENTNPPVSSDLIISGPIFKNVSQEKKTANTLKTSHPILTLKALFIKP